MISKEKLKWIRKSALEVARLQLEQIFQERFAMMFAAQLKQMEEEEKV